MRAVARTLDDVSIRVLVAGLPQLLSEIVGAGLQRDPGIDVQYANPESRPGTSRLDAAIDAHRPDAVVVGVGIADSAAVRTTQLRHPELALVVVAPDGANAWTVELRPEFVTVDPVSPSGLRRAVRTAVAEARRRHEPIDSCEPQPNRK